MHKVTLTTIRPVCNHKVTPRQEHPKMQSMWQLHRSDWFPRGRVAAGKSRLMQQKSDRLSGRRRKQIPRFFTSHLAVRPSRLGHYKPQPCSLSSPDLRPGQVGIGVHPAANVLSVSRAKGVNLAKTAQSGTSAQLWVRRNPSTTRYQRWRGSRQSGCIEDPVPSATPLVARSHAWAIAGSRRLLTSDAMALITPTFNKPKLPQAFQ